MVVEDIAFLTGMVISLIPECCERAKSIAVQAGRLIRAEWGKDKQYDSKNEDGTDLVTCTDKKVELFIFEQLRALYPSHRFLGEESSSGHDVQLDDGLTWVVDPIDGTTNFIQKYTKCTYCVITTSIDMIAVSIALCHHKRALLGVIYNPIRVEMYWAVQGQGAHLSINGSDAIKLKTAGKTKLSDAVICFGYSAHGAKEDTGCKLLKQVKPMLEYPIRGLRAFGAATINLMAVARGIADAYVETGLKPWDVAAGELIVREAGGCVYGVQQKEFSLALNEICACCGQSAADELFKILNCGQSAADESLKILN